MLIGTTDPSVPQSQRAMPQPMAYPYGPRRKKMMSGKRGLWEKRKTCIKWHWKKKKNRPFFSWIFLGLNSFKMPIRVKVSLLAQLPFSQVWVFSIETGDPSWYAALSHFSSPLCSKSQIPPTLTQHLYPGSQAVRCGVITHCCCLTPVEPWIFTPHGSNPELRGEAAAWSQHLVISEEAELERDIWPL